MVGCVAGLSGERGFYPAVFPGNLQNTGHSAGRRGVAEEPYLAALCAELAAAHFQFEELTLNRFELFVVGVCAELL